MSKLLWNALKVSPALLSASLVLASSAHAAASDPSIQIVPTTTTTTSESTASRESIAELNSQLLQTKEREISVSELNTSKTSSPNL